MRKRKIQKLIVDHLSTKSVVKQRVYDVTLEKFELLKEVLVEFSEEMNNQLNIDDKRINLEFHDRGSYIAQLRVAGDVLVFYMHSNAFEYDRDHKVWDSDYIKSDFFNSYSGVINIYNFLNDSFRYNRSNDLGYLVARIFVNKEGHFFVEGKRQRGMGVSKFGESILDRTACTKIVETAVLYVLEFDLLVPPYENMSVVSLAQMNEEIVNSKIPTGKRLGFIYNSDDVED